MRKKKIKFTLERKSKFAPFGILIREFKKATDKVQFLKEYRDYLEPSHNNKVNAVFVSNVQFLFKRVYEQ